MNRIKPTSTLLVLFTLTLLFASLLSTPPAFAASTTLSVSPQSGSYGKSFPVSLVIDGHGDTFNAAKATVTLSNTLTVKDLVLGDCNFSFMTTPSAANPSFEGAILGGSSKKCTVYTFTLIPTAKGNATISLTKATVRRYGDAVEVLSSTQGGSYTITAAVSTDSQSAQTQGTPVPTPANGLYSVAIKVFSSDNKPVNGATVNLSAVAGSAPLTVTTDKTGTAFFPNIKSGVYAATVEQQKHEVAKTILNVRGANHILTLGINIQAQQSNPLLKQQTLKQQTLQNNPLLLVGLPALGIVVGIVIALLPRFFKRSKKAAA